jgi:rhodanese-related sulfurtransferase
VFCSQGYTSSLAAASLLDIGFYGATDVIGGFSAWVAAGLPAALAQDNAVVLAPGAAPAAGRRG